MIPTIDDLIAMRVAEQTVLRTTTHTHLNKYGRERVGYSRGTRTRLEFDPARLEALVDEGFLMDAEGDLEADPARGRRRLVATELGRLEWRFASAENAMVAMRLDESFHRDGDIVVVPVKDRRHHAAGEDRPDYPTEVWTREHRPADPEFEGDVAMDVYQRTVDVEAYVNPHGERLMTWNPCPVDICTMGRFGRHTDAASHGMSVMVLMALDGAMNHRLYFQGGHTHIESACGTVGASASSDARNILLRFGMIAALPTIPGTRREDYAVTPRGRDLHAKAIVHVDCFAPRPMHLWNEYVERMGRVLRAA